MSCPGLHCDGCGKGKVTITAGGVLTLAGSIFYLTHKQTVDHAADDFFEWLFITLIVLLVAAVITAATVIAIKFRARQHRMATASAIAPPHVTIIPATIAPPAVARPARTATAALPSATRQVLPRLGGYPAATAEYAAPRRRRRCTTTRLRGTRP
jgi:hypothetical protein